LAIQHSMRVDRNVAVEMRDGTQTYVDVYRPAADGRYPVILQRTPYDKALITLALVQIDFLRAVEQGYAVVIQDVRGRYTSRGDFKPFYQEMNDGYDSVEWCASQPWSDGNVGMVGASYIGAVQWLAAVTAPPHLKAIVPVVTASDYYEGWTYQGGAFQWGFMVSWVPPYLATEAVVNERFGSHPTGKTRDQLVGMLDDMQSTFATLPLKDLPLMGELAPYYLEWLGHPSRDEFWKGVSIEDRHANVRVPALNVGGWYDIFLGGTLRNFTGVREKGATREARDGARLLIGPWIHSNPAAQVAGTVDMGVRSGVGGTALQFDQVGLYLRFFDRWLKGNEHALDEDAPVRLFVMGEGAWRDEQEWPLARTQFTSFYLHSGGRANSSSGDGLLSTQEPTSERADAYLYDPNNPVPTLGGQLCCYFFQFPAGAFDHRQLEQRPDVLVYSTPPLERDVEVTGPVTVNLWAVTDAPDTDFTAKLVDVFPDGTARNLTDGVVRARYRQGTDRPRPIRPNEPVQYTIDCWSTSNLFKAGHQIRLEISSSNFPRFDRNMNTGGELGADIDMRVAKQTILHDREHPSSVVLPIIPR
jgi:putative CocE/NonD family hydrolase